MIGKNWLALGCGGVLVGLMALSQAARAQDDAPVSANDKVVYKKRTAIDLTGAVIEGELTRPEGSYIVNRKISRFSNLVRIRSDYVPELLDSANDL